VEFGRLYRGAASDLNQAQTFVSGDTTVQYLNDLVARSYLAIYAKTKVDVWGFLRFLFWGYPAVFRRYLGYFLLAAAFVVAGALFGYCASFLDPDSRAFLLPQDMPTIRPSQSGEDDATPLMSTGQLAAFSSGLFANNLGVSLFAFALGITLGVGTAWLLWYNGIMLGALAAVFVEAGQFRTFCTGVLPHGVLELPACVLGGAAGFVLARGLLRARPWPRLEELARAGGQALLLVAGCVPLLAAAAVLEAGVARAPDWFLGSGLKLGVAAVIGLLFLAYLVLLGRGKHGRPVEALHAAP
jgi:uncharacterized membrane protein SpoIIM required for sporulation